MEHNKTKPLAHSHSSLDLFLTCPYRFYRERIVRDIPYAQNEKAAWGDEVHKLIEHFFKTGTFAPALNSFKQPIDAIAEVSGERYLEAELAVDKDWRQVDYKSKSAYFRAKVDLTLIQSATEIMVVDWKTGSSRYGDKKQAQRYAAMAFAIEPTVTVVQTRFVYLTENHIASKTFHRDQCVALTGEVDGVAKAIEACVAADAWQKKPSGLCRQYCDVLDCPHNGRGS